MRIGYPFQGADILRKKRALRRELLAQSAGFREVKVAILGGSTTAEIREMPELFLLDASVKPRFYESAFGMFYEEAVFGSDGLKAFAPDIVYFHTTSRNILRYPAVFDDGDAVTGALEAERDRFRVAWERVYAEFRCTIIQNNFEWPSERPLGNLEAVDRRGTLRFLAALNLTFADYAQKNSHFHLFDLNHLAAWYGLRQFHDARFWHSYKYALAYEAIPHLAHGVASIVRASLGLGKKCLVLDLDNTLWGGVIGDDGLSGIALGKETPVAEAHTALQRYARALGERGVTLAVCSKNDSEIAKSGFTHPDSVLELRDFAAFRANFEPKSSNLLTLAEELSLGVDSFVFLDDNPAERALVREHCRGVSVPEVGDRIEDFVAHLDRSGWFEPVALSREDLARATMYGQNAARRAAQADTTNYDAFLASLQMEAEIAPFKEIYLERITQLTNKTNQFNLTTRRYSAADLRALAESPRHVCLYGRLRDKFGDNGLISVVLGEIRGAELHIDLWLMSCRVLKREMEHAMFDALVEHARARGVERIVGYYLPTDRNGLVKNLYPSLGFGLQQVRADDSAVHTFVVPAEHTPRNRFIRIQP
jgi:FkbH-like protein